MTRGRDSPTQYALERANQVVTCPSARAPAHLCWPVPGASSSFFAMPVAPAIAHAPTAEDAAMMDDLEKYLALPVEDNLDLDVLSWWKARDHDKAADPASGRPAGLPDLAKMATQYLGRPASSAGVERMFSKAGKLHDDLKKGQVDDTLEHSLFASANTR